MFGEGAITAVAVFVRVGLHAASGCRWKELKAHPPVGVQAIEGGLAEWEIRREQPGAGEREAVGVEVHRKMGEMGRGDAMGEDEGSGWLERVGTGREEVEEGWARDRHEIAGEPVSTDRAGGRGAPDPVVTVLDAVVPGDGVHDDIVQGVIEESGIEGASWHRPAASQCRRAEARGRRPADMASRSTGSLVNV